MLAERWVLVEQDLRDALTSKHKLRSDPRWDFNTSHPYLIGRRHFDVRQGIVGYLEQEWSLLPIANCLEVSLLKLHHS